MTPDLYFACSLQVDRGTSYPSISRQRSSFPRPYNLSGEQRSASNSLRHGLLARCVLLEDECPQTFAALLADHIAHLQPADGLELGMVEHMAASDWRLRRAWAIETLPERLELPGFSPVEVGPLELELPRANAGVVPLILLSAGRHRLARDYAFALGVAWTLLRERRRYQIVYFLMQGLHLAAGLPVARLLGKPVVMKVSGSGIITIMRGSWLGRLELWFLRRWARRVMILNPGMAGEATAAGLDSDLLLWMPNPVDTDEFAPCTPERRRELRARFDLEPSAPTVVFVGRLAPEKELPSLIRAFAAARREVANAALVLVGDGPLRGELETLAAGLSLAGAIRFTGRQTGAEVREWLQASDVFALVSSNEGLACSLLEAMSVGLPSVVSDIPANVQLVETEVHGLHAALGSPDPIAGALRRLLVDAPLRARMGAAARQRVLAGYSIDKVMDRYEALFSEALDTERR